MRRNRITIVNPTLLSCPSSLSPPASVVGKASLNLSDVEPSLKVLKEKLMSKNVVSGPQREKQQGGEEEEEWDKGRPSRQRGILPSGCYCVLSRRIVDSSSKG